ncbi:MULTISPECIES: pentapeptide repeat-containing protein [unclassified Thermosynechococcus]|uniref:pentapeptide repeat-containing protein n=1 Tax=unclassified Thermosynechococcus TaxID=2622553 RepID=UPI00197F56E0|nr:MULTISPECIES: pentapeptide repeat-containing protein [unclassified Thermosynechococcus]MDR5638155.1 pentapeptide repeat-containing protein [Thermosynechococcus sp. PP42]MDR7920844.1 pentapeptide repeat-containing protein [Thermosynechococcus sp. HY213]QSF49463.1 pentapeptide repeat-containing protein [Thermosynechococcus sp. TA-1]WKT81484.1 pentapeptide repeat-containing protein [Thermosynechococcus sp. PP45]WNC22541.1 pentapeptide repeat-containing protein [Thermosynechococcus sp. PP22]
MSKAITLETLLSEFARGVRNFRGVNLAGSVFPLVQLSHVDLAGADLQGINWSGADLIKANLANANLRGANLIGADLSGANLTDANLQEAMLSGAILVGAYLSRANLQQAVLSGAILKGAVLHDSNLKDTNVVGADLSEADLTGAIARRQDLEEAKLSGTILPNGEVVFEAGEMEEVPLPAPTPMAKPMATANETTVIEWTNEQVIQMLILQQHPLPSTYQSADLKVVSLGNHCYQLRTVTETVVAVVEGESVANEKVTLFAEAPFADVVASVLQAHSFLPTQYVSEPVPAWHYEQVAIPSGQVVRWGTARQLWKTWWLLLKSTATPQEPQQLQLLVGKEWQPICDIAFSPSAGGGLIIKTAMGDRHFSGDASLIWLESVPSGLPTTSAPAVPPWNGLLKFENNCLTIETAAGLVCVQGENLRVTLGGQAIALNQL